MSNKPLELATVQLWKADALEVLESCCLGSDEHSAAKAIISLADEVLVLRASQAALTPDPVCFTVTISSSMTTEQLEQLREAMRPARHELAPISNWVGAPRVLYGTEYKCAFCGLSFPVGQGHHCQAKGGRHDA